MQQAQLEMIKCKGSYEIAMSTVPLTKIISSRNKKVFVPLNKTVAKFKVSYISIQLHQMTSQVKLPPQHQTSLICKTEGMQLLIDTVYYIKEDSHIHLLYTLMYTGRYKLAAISLIINLNIFRYQHPQRTFQMESKEQNRTWLYEQCKARDLKLP